MTCTIYKITNSINNKVYIGQTWRTINQRFSHHKSPQNKHCLKLVHALNKHGRENFKIEAIAACSDQVTADYLECLYIKEYDSVFSGYNIREGGSMGKQTEESKKKISIANTGKVRSKETRLKDRLVKLGKVYGPCSDEKKLKISQANKGKKRTPEQIARIIKAIKIAKAKKV